MGCLTRKHRANIIGAGLTQYEADVRPSVPPPYRSDVQD